MAEPAPFIGEYSSAGASHAPQPVAGFGAGAQENPLFKVPILFIPFHHQGSPPFVLNFNENGIKFTGKHITA
jgi:hypothetical protein